MREVCGTKLNRIYKAGKMSDIGETAVNIKTSSEGHAASRRWLTGSKWDHVGHFRSLGPRLHYNSRHVITSPDRSSTSARTTPCVFPPKLFIGNIHPFLLFYLTWLSEFYRSRHSLNSQRNRGTPLSFYNLKYYLIHTRFEINNSIIENSMHI